MEPTSINIPNHGLITIKAKSINVDASFELSGYKLILGDRSETVAEIDLEDLSRFILGLDSELGFCITKGEKLSHYIEKKEE